VGVRGQAAEVRGGEQFVLKADETVADDLYVFGQQITIDGTVEGDLIVFGQQITVNGTVSGDVIAAGQTVVIAGPAEGARIAGQVLKLTSKAKLDRDLVAAGFSLECEPGSSIGGDVLYGGFQTLLAGDIEDDLRGGMANCKLSGTIGGDIDVEVGGEGADMPPTAFGPPPPVAFPSVPSGLTISDTAKLRGKLTYQGPQEAKIDPKAEVAGPVDYRPQVHQAGQAPPPKTWVQKALERLRHLACVAVVGLAALLVMPNWTRAWADNVRTRPGMSLLGGVLGVLGFIALLVVAAVAIVLAAILFGVTTLAELVPLVVVGGLVSYAALIVGFWLLAAFLGEAIAGLALGRTAVRGEGFGPRFAALLLGLVLLGLVLSIPNAAPWIAMIVFVFGFGGFCLWLVGVLPRPAA
jgi:cytoskeletal protein CcmA (bactofilin family)